MRRTAIDVDVIPKKRRGPSSSSSSSSPADFALQTGYLEPEQKNLVDQLANMGFDAASDFVARHDTERIRAAIARVGSLPPGAIRNPPGLIRYLVTKPGKIQTPKPATDAAKYTKGKYGHMVKK